MVEIEQRITDRSGRDLGRVVGHIIKGDGFGESVLREKTNMIWFDVC